jgi:FKBP-type peptidyl-prolyl cis-trans isomerase
VLAKGDGAKPGPGDTVKVHYRGTLLDGTEFDSSYARKQPADFRPEQVIPGWSEALQLMQVGDKWKLFIGPDLAYGDRGIDPVEPGSLLVFEVELIGVTKAAADEEPTKDKE